MKRIIWVAWLLALALILGGCAKTTPTPGAETGNSRIVVGFSQIGTESDWRNANTKSMTLALSEDNGYRLIFSDAQQKRDKQIAAIRDFIKQDVDYIVVAPVTEDGWETVLAEARKAEIPVIIVDRMIDVKDESLFTCWVGTNSRKESEMAVAWLETTYGNAPLRIAHLQGTMGSTAQLGRTAGLDAGLAEHSQWSLVFRDTGNFTDAGGKKLVKQLIDSGVAFDVIFAENDDMAIGAVEAMEEAGLQPGVDAAIISFDGNRPALELSLEGKINCVVECNPLHGPRVQALIEQLEAGETPAKYVYVEDGEVFETASLTEEIIKERPY